MLCAVKTDRNKMEQSSQEHYQSLINSLRERIASVEIQNSNLMKQVVDKQRSNFSLSQELERCQKSNLMLLEELQACKTANMLMRDTIEKQEETAYKLIEEIERVEKSNNLLQDELRQFGCKIGYGSRRISNLETIEESSLEDQDETEYLKAYNELANLKSRHLRTDSLSLSSVSGYETMSEADEMDSNCSTETLIDYSIQYFYQDPIEV